MSPRLAVVVLLALACAEDPASSQSPALGSPARRWLSPPAGVVRAYPPHAIRVDGVGPYRLGAPLADVLHALPDAPRVELLQVGSFLDWRVVRAEAGAILVGADARNRVAFISVLTPDVARTASGVGVGTRGDELLRALGPERSVGDVARARASFEFAGLPGVLFVTDSPEGTPPERTRVAAVVVLGAGPDAARRGADAAGATGATARRHGRSACRDGGALASARSEVASIARGGARPAHGGAHPLMRFGCVSAGSPEAVIAGPEQVVVVGGDRGRVRRAASLPIVGVDLLLPFDHNGDGRDEVLVGLAGDAGGDATGEGRWVEVRVYTWQAGRLAELFRERPFAISEEQAAVAGVALADVELSVEVSAADRALVARGLYLAPGNAGARDVVPLLPVRLGLASRRLASGGSR